MSDNTEGFAWLVWGVPIAIGVFITIVLLFQGTSPSWVYLPGLGLILIGLVWCIETP